MKISRRELLVAGAAALTAGCSVGPGNNSGSQIIPAQQVPDQDQVLDKNLILSIPPGAVAPATIADFAKARGVDVTVHHQTSVDAVLIEVAARSVQYDVVLLGRYGMLSLMAQNLLEPVDHTLVPNTRLITSPFGDPPYDSGSNHSIGKDYTTVGYATNTTVIDPADTWVGFFDLARRFPREVSVPNDAENVIGAAMLALGHSWSSASASNLNEVRRFLRPLRHSLVLRSTARHPNRIGRRLAALGSSMDFRSPESGTRFVVPKEGAVANMRSYCIATFAPDPVTAHAWLNDTLLPTVAAHDTVASQRASVVGEANYVVPSPMLVNPAIYPPAEVISKLQLSNVSEADADARAVCVARGEAAMIAALAKLFTILLIAFLHSQQPSQAYSGAAPVVATSPGQPQANQAVTVHLYAMPKGAADVDLITADGAWPAKPAGRRAFVVRNVPAPGASGPWPLSVRFDLRGHTYTTTVGVIDVRPAPKS